MLRGVPRASALWKRVLGAGSGRGITNLNVRDGVVGISSCISISIQYHLLRTSAQVSTSPGRPETETRWNTTPHVEEAETHDYGSDSGRPGIGQHKGGPEGPEGLEGGMR
jgi:hypothetical protein